MKKLLRPDFVFSYWIFIWFILYFTHIVTVSPKLWLLLAIFSNLITIILMLKSKFYYIFRFIFLTIFMKFIPVYLLRNEPILKVHVYYSILVFILYNLWLFINGQSLYSLYKLVYNSQFENSKYIGLFSTIYDKCYAYIKIFINKNN